MEAVTTWPKPWPELDARFAFDLSFAASWSRICEEGRESTSYVCQRVILTLSLS